MKQAYDEVWLNKNEFPSSWRVAQLNHQKLYTTDYTQDLQFKK